MTDNKAHIIKLIKKFYSKEENKKIFIEHVLPILTEKSKISLRFLEKYIVNYCKDVKQFPMIVDCKGNKSYVDINSKYQAQLDSFLKQNVDPFKRRQSTATSKSSVSSSRSISDVINFEYDKGKSIKTTHAQLNYFRWLIESGILLYIEKNYEKIKTRVDEYDKNGIGRIKKDKRRQTREKKKLLNDLTLLVNKS